MDFDVAWAQCPIIEASLSLTLSNGVHVRYYSRNPGGDPHALLKRTARLFAAMRSAHSLRIRQLVALVNLTAFTLVSCSECYVDSDPVPAPGPQPNMLIGIGAQKCGTDFLYGLLSQHPKIIPAYKKELHLFDSAVFESTLETYHNYLHSWEGPRQARGDPEDGVLLEITPRYLMVSLDGYFVIILCFPVEGET